MTNHFKDKLDESCTPSYPGCTWLTIPPRPPSSRQVARLYGAPEYIPNEAPSAWFYRIAAQYDNSVKCIRKLLDWTTDSGPGDFDGAPNNVEQIGHITMQDASRLAAMFDSNSRILQRAPRPYAFLTNRLDGSPIYRFCAHCLTEDTVPYIRLAWRLDPIVLCQRHGVALSEICPSCCHVIDYSLSGYIRFPEDHRDDVIRFCPTCRAPLTNDLPPRLPETVIKFLQALTRFVFGNPVWRHLRVSDEPDQLPCSDVASALLRAPTSGYYMRWHNVFTRQTFDEFLNLFEGHIETPFHGPA